MLGILFSICIAGCKSALKLEPERENVYELLITSSDKKIGGKFFPLNIIVYLNAVEYDKNRVLRQLYSDFYYLGRNILNDGWRKHARSLEESGSQSVFRIDFRRFQYRDYNIDIARGAGAMFTSCSCREEFSWTTDSIPLDELTGRTVVLVDPDYEMHLDGGIYIPHACRFITESNISHVNVKHIFVYDRNRQMTVAADFRHLDTNETTFDFKLTKAIGLTRDEFYEFWSEPEEFWEDTEIPLPDPTACFDHVMARTYVMELTY